MVGPHLIGGGSKPGKVKLPNDLWPIQTNKPHSYNDMKCMAFENTEYLTYIQYTTVSQRPTRVFSEKEKKRCAEGSGRESGICEKHDKVGHGSGNCKSSEGCTA